jgi:hypothetical protein
MTGTHLYGGGGHRHPESLYLQQKDVRCGNFKGWNVKIPFFAEHFSIIAKVDGTGSNNIFQYVVLKSKQFSIFFKQGQIIEIPQMKDSDGAHYKFKVRSIAGDSVCLQIQ